MLFQDTLFLVYRIKQLQLLDIFCYFQDEAIFCTAMYFFLFQNEAMYFLLFQDEAVFNSSRIFWVIFRMKLFLIVLSIFWHVKMKLFLTVLYTVCYFKMKLYICFCYFRMNLFLTVLYIFLCCSRENICLESAICFFCFFRVNLFLRVLDTCCYQLLSASRIY